MQNNAKIDRNSKPYSSNGKGEQEGNQVNKIRFRLLIYFFQVSKYDFR